METLNDSEIARRYGELLGVNTSAGVANYLKKSRELTAGKLVEISQFVERSIDWLLMGVPEDEASTNPLRLSESELVFIEWIARAEGKTFGETAREFLQSGMMSKAVALAQAYQHIPPEQLKDVLDIVLPHQPRKDDSTKSSRKRR